MANTTNIRDGRRCLNLKHLRGCMCNYDSYQKKLKPLSIGKEKINHRLNMLYKARTQYHIYKSPYTSGSELKFLNKEINYLEKQKTQLELRKNLHKEIRMLEKYKSTEGLILKEGDIVIYSNEFQLVQKINSSEDDNKYNIQNIKVNSDIDNNRPEMLKKKFNFLEHEFNGLNVQETTLKGKIDGEKFETILTSFKHIKRTLKELIEGNAKYNETVRNGENIEPIIHIIKEHKEIIIPNDGTIIERYTQISGNISDLTKSINENFTLISGSNIEESFMKAKQKISDLASSPPSKISTIAGALANKLPYASKMFKSVEGVIDKNTSVQKHINYLFGIVAEKYEILVTVGEKLQHSKAHMEAQIYELEKLLIDSETFINKYKKQSDIPMSEISINTQIKSSIEKYKGRLVKIDGSLIATQQTIIMLGKDLPSMKSDLIDEMAISNILNNVGDYQTMFSEIAELASEVTKATSEKTHQIIENLYEVQINDTHTMEYLADTATRSKKLGTMLVNQTERLGTKVIREAAFIKEIVKGTDIQIARENILKIQ